MMKRISILLTLFGCLLLLIPACATVPKESVDLSTELTAMIRSAEQSHLALLDEYLTERKHKIDDFIDKTWAPKFMENAMQKSNILTLIEQQRDPAQKAALLTEFSQDAVAQITRRHISLGDAIDQIGSALRAAITAHYADMLTVNQALTAHLRSAADVNESRERLLTDLHVDTKTLLPMDKITALMEKVLSHQGDVDEVTKYVEEAKTLLKGK